MEPPSGTKFNGVSYIIQRGAEAVYSEAGQAEVKQLVGFYMENAAIIRKELSRAGLTIYGGEHAYVWIKTPDGMDSWGFFDHLRTKLMWWHPRQRLRGSR